MLHKKDGLCLENKRPASTAGFAISSSGNTPSCLQFLEGGATNIHPCFIAATL